MKKLIATDFDYSYTDAFGAVSARGSYLGRRAASARTIRAFIRRNWDACHFSAELKSVRIGASWTSPWIAKLLLCCVALTLSACSVTSPLAPSATDARSVSALQSIDEVRADAPPTASDVVAAPPQTPAPTPTTYTCYTQPRTYCASNGRKCWLEVDHYTQSAPCPRVPID